MGENYYVVGTFTHNSNYLNVTDDGVARGRNSSPPCMAGGGTLVVAGRHVIRSDKDGRCCSLRKYLYDAAYRRFVL